MTRAEIEARLLAWMRDEPEREDEARFAALALALFRHQAERCAPYARWCLRRGVTPERVESWREIPAVPSGAFKELALRSFPAERTVKVFRTSGTAATRRGELHLDTLALYEASLVPSFERGVLPELRGREARIPLLVLAPSAEEAPDSSLSHMFAVMLDRRGAEGSGWFVRDGRLEAEALIARLRALAAREHAFALCGTAFALVHLVEALAARGERLALPEGARVMETGGFKGRARERSPRELYAEIEAALGVPPERIVNQYGMTELGSQFYDSVLARPGEPRRKLAPPWTRVRLVDPESGAEVPGGTVGAIRILDLANTGSVLAVQTADLGRAVGDGFEVLGREPGAEARGCSIAADEMLGAAR
jgi:hypothetical protein